MMEEYKYPDFNTARYVAKDNITLRRRFIPSQVWIVLMVFLIAAASIALMPAIFSRDLEPQERKVAMLIGVGCLLVSAFSCYMAFFYYGPKHKVAVFYDNYMLVIQAKSLYYRYEYTDIKKWGFIPKVKDVNGKKMNTWDVNYYSDKRTYFLHTLLNSGSFHVEFKNGIKRDFPVNDISFIRELVKSNTCVKESLYIKIEGIESIEDFENTCKRLYITKEEFVEKMKERKVPYETIEKLVLKAETYPKFYNGTYPYGKYLYDEEEKN